jgi:hypothetical protein
MASKEPGNPLWDCELSLFWRSGGFGLTAGYAILQPSPSTDPTLNRLICRQASKLPGDPRGDSMPDIPTRPRSMPSIVPGDIPAMSDDECLVRLAQAVADHDSGHLDEVARLIARLAVTIE